MDPNAALEELREMVEWLLSHDPPSEDDIQRLCDLFQGLDEWLTRGGFRPQAWSQHEHRPRSLVRLLESAAEDFVKRPQAALTDLHRVARWAAEGGDSETSALALAAVEDVFAYHSGHRTNATRLHPEVHSRGIGHIRLALERFLR